jgi:uncharacterized membrane protein
MVVLFFQLGTVRRRLEATTLEVASLRTLLAQRTARQEGEMLPPPATLPLPVTSPLPAALSVATTLPLPAPTVSGSIAAAPAAPPVPPAMPAATPPPASLPGAQPPPPRPPGRPWHQQPLFNWFFGSHAVVKIGVVVLLFGMGFFVKYAADQGWLNLPLRLAGAWLLGLALMAIGFRTQRRNPVYGTALQGGGFGIAYMTTYATQQLYNLIPAAVSFPVMLALTALCTAAALLSNARILAALATFGGFLAPVLTAAGPGDPFLLFSYLAVLNLGVLAVSWFKRWSELHLISFGATTAIAFLWGAENYGPPLFNLVQPFVAAFFLFHVALVIVQVRRSEHGRLGLIEGILLFATPLVTLAMVVPIADGLSTADGERYLTLWLAAMALVYLLAGLALLRSADARYGFLRESFLAFGTLAATLALWVALIDNELLASALWALEGAGLFWLGLRQQRRFFQFFGLLLHPLAALLYLAELTSDTANSGNGVVLMVAAFATGYAALRFARSLRQPAPAGAAIAPAGHWSGSVAVLAAAAGWGWLYSTGALQIADRLVFDQWGLAFALLFGVTAAAGEWLARRLEWGMLRLPALLVIPVLLVTVVMHAVANETIFGAWGWTAWPLLFAVHFWLLWRQDFAAEGLFHVAGLWSLVLLITVQAVVEAGRFVDSWQGAGDGWFVVAWTLPATVTLLALALVGERLAWPVARHRRAYLVFGAGGLALGVAGILALAAFISTAVAQPLPYVPFFNVVDLAGVLAVGAASAWILALHREGIGATRWLALRLGVMGFAFLLFNAMLARAVYHAGNVVYDAGAMMASSQLQILFSISWSVLALALMFGATRRRSRWVWTTGAFLLGLTVLKLFVIDLASSDTLPRIVSFIGVGLLMLVIGWLAPAPPAQAVAEEPPVPPPAMS